MTQARIGWRAFSGSQSISTLLTSLYSSWNGDISGSGLNTSIYGAWNGETEENLSSLETSLFSVYNGESNTNDSYGTNNGTAVGSLTYTSGKVGNAFSFNGTNAYVSLPNNSLNFTGDFSVSFWVNPTSGIYTWKSIISNYKAGGSFGYGYAIGINEYYDKLQIFIRNNNQITQQWFDYAFTANTWHHVVISRKASNYTKCYINGTLVSGYYPVGGQTDPTFNPAYISNQIANIGGGNNTAGFNGKLDSVNIWTKELTQTEATQLYNSGMGIEYPFVGKLISSPKDAVGTNHGTLTNGSLITTGKIGNAFTFDGVNDYVSFPTNSWNSTIGSDFSVSLWVKFTSTANQTLVSNMSSPSINVWSGWEIRLVGGQPTIYIWNNSGTGVGAQGAVVSTNTWYHIVATRKKGSRTRIYINGSLAQTDTNTPDPSISGTYYPNIGHLQYSSSFHGLYMANGSLIDAVNLWNREITAEEVSQLYNGGSGVQYPYTNAIVASSKNSFGIDNGTLMNGCSITDAKIGKAFTFDGVNDYVQLPNNSLNLTGDFSVSAWIYVSNLSGEKFLISNVNGNAIGLNFGWCFGLYDNKLSFGSYGNTVYSAWIGVDTLLVNTWYHVLVTKKSSQKPKFYINGNLSTCSLHPNCTGTDSTNPIYSSATYPNIKSSIGTYIYNNGSSSYAYWNGKIDALNVWKKELTQAEVTELYNSGAGKQIVPTTTIVTDGLVLNLDASRTSSYPGSGTTWTDISGSGNNGTMVNGVGYTGGNEGALVFDGINDYVDTGLQYSLTSSTNFTIGIWFKGFGRSSNNDILVLSYSGTPVGWAIYQANTGKFMCFSRDNNNVETAYMSSTTSTNTNQWFYGVYKKSGNLFSLYINGVLEATSNANLGNISISSGMRIGNHTITSQPYVGSIGNVHVYNRDLSDIEITQNFNATKTRFGL